jgi:hypothetical protein
MRGLGPPHRYSTFSNQRDQLMERTRFVGPGPGETAIVRPGEGHCTCYVYLKKSAGEGVCEAAVGMDGE